MLYIDNNNSGKIEQKPDVLVGVFRHLTDDESRKHASPGNPTPSQLKEGLRYIELGKESLIRVYKKENFTINKNFFSGSKSEVLKVFINMSKDKDSGYFYNWGDELRARTYKDSDSKIRGNYLVSGGGFECVNVVNNVWSSTSTVA